MGILSNGVGVTVSGPVAVTFVVANVEDTGGKASLVLASFGE